LILDSEAAAMLDAQTGDRPGQVGRTKHGSGTNAVFGKFARSDRSFVNDGVSDSGGASRFFFRADYDEGETP